MNIEKAKVKHACVRGALFCAALLSVGGLSAAAEQTPSDTAEGRKETDEFHDRDTDGDKRLLLEELLSRQPETAHARLRQRFVTLDFDGSGDLDREEFRKISSPPGERGNVPDPIADLERETAEKWRRAFADADGDGDGSLSSKEWPAKRMALAAPELADLTFRAWDRDGSGTVTVEEGVGLLEVAYGLRRPDGRPLRTANGRVLSWNYLRMLDSDRDGVLSRDEFVPKYLLGEAKNAERFSELDADQDGRLDDDEMAPAFWRDTLGEFFSLDADGDGRLTTEDVLKFGYAEGVARRTVRACDDDGDGKLSFIEFRATTYENPTSDWYASRRDADNDGRLSWREFFIEESPVLTAQCRYIFDRFDVDKDGYLSYAEWDFEVDLEKVPPEAWFSAKDLDGDGKLAFSEVFVEKKPADGDPQAMDRFEMRLAAAENRFQSDDQDGNGYLDLEELTRSRESAIEAARRHSKTLSNRKTMLEGNYYVRKGVLVVNEIAFLAIVLWVVRKTKPKQERADILNERRPPGVE